MNSRFTLLAISFFIFGLSCNLLLGQKASYKILVGGIEVGIQRVHQQQIREKIRIDIESKVHISMLVSYTIEYRQWAIYQDGFLQESKVEVIKNGKIHKSTHTLWTGSHYRITKDEKTSTLHQKIYYSGCLIYFTPPKNAAYKYSEAEGLLEPISKCYVTSFETKHPTENRTNEYYYKNGVLERTIIQDALLKFKTQRLY